MKDKDTLRYEIEQDQEWRYWVDKIPYIKFDPKWNVKIIPPFGNAIARFYIEFENRHVSIYLDCYDKLGYCGFPYWEIYPYKDDVGRCKMNDTISLLSMIRESLENKE